ncbi:NAD(P)-binding protein [Coniophora puteana RWD-64-598 SS2]|uniref:NAD(P)-binding protein n=1 Tax=Coniophora puteana (strain RWD-64-598) TaxID=741705 RepID=A0A5M3N4A2_CONPW|nr:NAD(P)-binding protein [Coniophora puteana RWD-64-598 SS2]EIW86126.1 NAD(P)-binding protein [Coniophora puteana RWD-64-598 SS2]
MSLPALSPYHLSLALTLPGLLLLWRNLRFRFYASRRARKIPHAQERVLILGASSGVGRSVAHVYVKRGAKVCIVGRRRDKLDDVARECRAMARGGAQVLMVKADCADPEEMVSLRERLEEEWQGLDTVIITAGVSALRPMMSNAGVEMDPRHPPKSQATAEGLTHAISVSNAAITGNFTGPLVSALSLIPLLTLTSRSPSILLLSSAAAVIPAPTRALYAATKAASLLLYQALAIEHPQIAFTFFLAGTIEGDFRASAVDKALPPNLTSSGSGSDSSEPTPLVREANPAKHGLKVGWVAQRCAQAVDRGEKNVFTPMYMRFGHLFYWIVPAYVEWRARVKYRYT